MLERIDRKLFDELVQRNTRQLIAPRSTVAVRRPIGSSESDTTPTRRALRSPMAKECAPQPEPKTKPQKKTKYKFISKEKK